MTPHGYWKVEVITPDPFLIEELSTYFFSHGSSGVEEILKRRSVRGIRAYIDTKIPKKKIRQSILQICGPRKAPLKIAAFRDKKWIDAWKKFLKPVYVGRKIFVRHDPKETLPKRFPKDGIILDIKPTFAFGTGQHATTFLCLKEIIELAKDPSFSKLRILDLGCGTAILALAAHSLGGRNIRALDVDPMAISASRENIETHGVKRGLTVQLGSLTAREKPYDIIIANIMLQTHLKLCKAYGESLKKDGKIILSGLLVRQEDEMRACLRKNGFFVEQITKRRGWIRVDARKK